MRSLLKLAKRVGVSARVITASVTTAVMVVGGCASAPDPLGGAQHFTADFLSVAGVFEGNPITVLGLEVGKVDRVVTRSRYVEVHMTVDKGVDIPKNVQAALVSPSIVTDRHIELTPRYTGGDKLRDNAAGVTEVVDVTPLLMQNLDRSVNRQEGFIRTHALLGTGLSGEIVSLFCERVQMRSDGCRTGKMEDFGPDFGLMAALLGLTR